MRELQFRPFRLAFIEENHILQDDMDRALSLGVWRPLFGVNPLDGRVMWTLQPNDGDPFVIFYFHVWKEEHES